MTLSKSDVNRILEALDAGFMRPQVWQDDVWEVSADHGSTYFVPVSVAGTNPGASIADYVEAPIDTDDDGNPIMTRRDGVWCAQLSAPGYMDQTDLSVFDTEDEAREYLAETYGDSVDLDDESDDE